MLSKPPKLSCLLGYFQDFARKMEKIKLSEKVTNEVLEHIG
jgi:hypothetical protein